MNTNGLCTLWSIIHKLIIVMCAQVQRIPFVLRWVQSLAKIFRKVNGLKFTGSGYLTPLFKSMNIFLDDSSWFNHTVTKIPNRIVYLNHHFYSTRPNKSLLDMFQNKDKATNTLSSKFIFLVLQYVSKVFITVESCRSRISVINKNCWIVYFIVVDGSKFPTKQKICHYNQNDSASWVQSRLTIFIRGSRQSLKLIKLIVKSRKMDKISYLHHCRCLYCFVQFVFRYKCILPEAPCINCRLLIAPYHVEVIIIIIIEIFGNSCKKILTLIIIVTFHLNYILVDISLR